MGKQLIYLYDLPKIDLETVSFSGDELRIISIIRTKLTNYHCSGALSKFLPTVSGAAIGCDTRDELVAIARRRLVQRRWARETRNLGGDRRVVVDGSVDHRQRDSGGGRDPSRLRRNQTVVPEIRTAGSNGNQLQFQTVTRLEVL